MIKNKQFAVIGLGRFGQAVVETLSKNGYDVMGCDKNMENVKRVEPIATDVAQLDVMDEDALNAIGLNNYDAVIIAIGNNLEASIMATMHAKEKGVKTIIAKAKTAVQKSLLEKIGADKVVMPERDSGHRLAIGLITTNVIEYISFSDTYGMAEIEPRPEWLNKSISESDIRAKYGLNIVAIKRNKDVIVTPPPSLEILPDDIIVVIGENTNIEKFS
jgi:trk system potassium uptake protein TrkA